MIAEPHRPASGEFRADLQILRALAVIIVLLFHLDISLFKGGFIGVDVFFVLSGYFVTHTLIGRTEKIGWRDVIGFYNRRIRRILPLATVVLLIAMAAAPFLLAPPEIKDIVAQIKAAALGTSNKFYSDDNDYFIETLFRPLLHFWSLGVEYQYYLFFPLIFLAAARFKWAGPLIFTASFIHCAIQTEDAPENAFFLLTPRIWEFMLGFYAFKFKDADFFKQKPYAQIVPILSIAAIIVCAMLYDAKMFFPGGTAAIPALATALLIYYGLPDGRGILSYPHRALVWIGTLSFSIYLWHYPIIWLFTYEPFVYYPNPDTAQIVGIVCITLILSVLSYQFIEEPMRSIRSLSTQKFYMIMAVLYALLAGMGGFYAYKNYHLRTFTDRQKAVLFAVEDRLPYRCDKESRMQSKDFESCRLGEPGKTGHKKILLVGDSHADAIKSVFMKLLPEYGHDLYIMKPNDNPGQGGHDADYFLNEAKKREISDLVLHGYIRDQNTLDEMEKIIASAKKSGIRVSIIDPTPVFERSVVTDVYLGKFSNLNHVGYRGQNKDYFIWREKIQKKFPSVRFYGVEKKLCPDMCPFEIGGRVLYFDAHHLTVSGTMLLAPAVRSIYKR